MSAKQSKKKAPPKARVKEKSTAKGKAKGERKNQPKGDHLFKPGNQIWRLRSKHGRDKLFKTPALLLEAAYEYFQWCEDTPLIEDSVEKIKVNGVGEEILRVPLNKLRAYTLHGLCIYLDVNTTYFNDFENSLEGKGDKISKDFSKVITRIREIIYEQKFTGAAAGFLKENIISRDLGLADKKQHDLNVEQPLFK